MTRMTASSTIPEFTATSGHNSLSARIALRSELDASTVQAMFDLYTTYYADTSSRIFTRDLEQKTHVLLLTQGDEDLCGFTTLEVYCSRAAGPQVRVLFSGDTIVDPNHWGNPALALRWIQFAGMVARRDALPLYWLLIVKGHRTYRFLPTFAKRYIPHHRLPELREEREILSALAREKFGNFFDEVTGVVQFPNAQGRLIDELADVPERHGNLPAVAHFLRLNPGYRDGDELVCLCRLAADNLRPLAARVFSPAPESSDPAS